MGQKLVQDNYRLEVYARSPGDFGCAYMSGVTEKPEETIRRLESIADQIRRHCDDLPSRGNRGVSIVSDEHVVCEHCGHRWTEDTKEHNGGCCDKDCEAMEAYEAAAK